MTDVPTLVAKIIMTWQKYGEVDLRTKEGQSFSECGLYDILDLVCKTVGIPKDKISLTNNNWAEYHKEYKIIKAPFSYEIMQFSQQNKTLSNYVGDKFYGLFLGRINTPRIEAMVLSRRRFIPSLTSFNGDVNVPYAQNIIGKILTENKYEKREVQEATLRHGPIDGLVTPPIIPPANCFGKHWQSAYSQIVVELVLETTDWPDSFHITEKTLRPIYYKRPFILVGARGFMDKLRQLGFKTFENIIPNYYENFDYCVEQAFECLDKTYAKNFYGSRPHQLLDDCKEDIEHNYKLLLELSSEHCKSYNKYGGLSYFGQ